MTALALAERFAAAAYHAYAGAWAVLVPDIRTALALAQAAQWLAAQDEPLSPARQAVWVGAVDLLTQEGDQIFTRLLTRPRPRRST